MAGLRVVSKSGNVDVIAEAGGGISVSGGVLVTEPDGTVVVNVGSKSLEVRCEPGTDVVVGTMSGSIRFHGEFGAVRVATKSGKIEIEEATEVDARTASGSVRVDECAGACRAVVTLGVDSGRTHRVGVARGRERVLARRRGRLGRDQDRQREGRARQHGDRTRRDPERFGNGRGVGAGGPCTAGPPQIDRGSDAQRVSPGHRRRDQREDGQRNDSDRMQVTTLEGAIVFTDIVGFTELTDTHGDEYAIALLERQEVLVRAALRRRVARREGAR